MGGRVIVCPASMSDWRYMKQVIYKVFKVSIIVALVALILFFIVNRIPGGKSLINNTKEKLSDIHDKTDDGADIEAEESTVSTKELWNPDNDESFNVVGDFSATIFMRKYEIKSFMVVGKEITEEINDVKMLNREEYKKDGNKLTGEYSIVKVVYTITDPLCDQEYSGNRITIANNNHKIEPVKMIPYIYDPIDPKHFHYTLEKNVIQEFTNYYVIPDNYLDESQKWTTHILINPNGLPTDYDYRPSGVTDAMFFKVYLGSFEGKQVD